MLSSCGKFEMTDQINTSGTEPEKQKLSCGVDININMNNLCLVVVLSLAASAAGWSINILFIFFHVYYCANLHLRVLHLKRLTLKLIDSVKWNSVFVLQ